MELKIIFMVFALTIVHTIMLLTLFSVLQELGLNSDKATILGAILVNLFVWSFTTYKMNEVAKRFNKELKEAKCKI